MANWKNYEQVQHSPGFTHLPQVQRPSGFSISRSISLSSLDRKLAISPKTEAGTPFESRVVDKVMVSVAILFQLDDLEYFAKKTSLNCGRMALLVALLFE